MAKSQPKSPAPSKSSSRYVRQHGLSKIIGLLAVVIIVFLFGVYTGRQTLSHTSKNSEFNVGIPLRSGPWGKMDYLPITIATPTELLSIKRTEEQTITWHFKGYTRDHLVTLFDTIKMPPALRDEMLQPAKLKVLPNAVEMLPSKASILALPDAVRQELYQVLAGIEENQAFKEIILTEVLDDLVKANEISPASLAMFKRMSTTVGVYHVCFCLPYFISEMSSYSEKEAFLKAMTSQKTMLLKLRITPDTDINALSTYWGKAHYSTDSHALFESLKKLPGGAKMDVIEILPPLPSSLLYSYPVPQSTTNGVVEKRDCHWSSFNFFRDPPDPRFSDTSYCAQKLKTDYFPVNSDPRYGDVVFFGISDDNIIHSAVYIADDIVFTKNGNNNLNPWILSTIPELKKIYSISVPPGKELRISYYRNKYY